MNEISFAAAGLVITLAAAGPACAADSIQDGSAALGALSEAAGLAGESSLKTAAAVSVIPAASVAAGALSVALPAVAVGMVAAGAMGNSVRVTESGPTPRPHLVVSRQIVIAQPAPIVPYDTQPQAPAQAQQGAR